MLDRETAEQNAKDLLRKMKTPGWAFRLWENLGWHYAVENSQGLISVHELLRNGVSYYFCMLTDSRDVPGCGSMMWTDHRQYLNPNRAVAETVKAAREAVDELDNLIREVERDLKEK